MSHRAVFALAELDAPFTNHVILLADARHGKPRAVNSASFQLIMPGEELSRLMGRQLGFD